MVLCWEHRGWLVSVVRHDTADVGAHSVVRVDVAATLHPLRHRLAVVSQFDAVGQWRIGRRCPR